MMRAYLGIAALLLAGAGDRGPSLSDLARLGNAALTTGDFNAAAVWYESAVEHAPNSPEPAYDLALSYYRMGLYDQATRYLDKAQPLAHGDLAGRCFLLRADIEYRQAMAENPARQVVGLERALKLYRAAIPASGESATVSRIAKYDIEVVKLRLPAAKSRAPQVASQGNPQEDAPADDTKAANDNAAKPHGRQQPQEDRDW